MEYIIYLFMFLLAGFIFGKIINMTQPKKKDYKYEIAMLEAQKELLKDPKHCKLLQHIEDMKHPKIEMEQPLYFGKSYWTKSKNNDTKI